MTGLGFCANAGAGAGAGAIPPASTATPARQTHTGLPRQPMNVGRRDATKTFTPGSPPAHPGPFAAAVVVADACVAAAATVTTTSRRRHRLREKRGDMRGVDDLLYTTSVLIRHS